VRDVVAGARDFAYGPPRLRTILGRVADWFVDLARVPPPGLRGPGGDISADALPVVLLFQQEADENGVVTTLAAVPDLSSAAGVRVVLVLDRPHLALARRAGVPVELVPERMAWEQRHASRSWHQYVEQRLAMLQRDYAAAATFRVPGDGLSSLERTAIIAAMRPAPSAWRRMAAWRRARTALVRMVDPPPPRQPAESDVVDTRDPG
jgi:hypothetical protein